MSVIDDLSEEEAYLWAILSDPSGLDLAEFSWEDPEHDDYCWRAWDYQWKWFRNIQPLQIDQCGRSVGKSLSLKVRAFCFPFIHAGQEMVITAPEGNHLTAITGLIETQFRINRLGREMLVSGRQQGITHRPFEVTFRNGSRIMGRIPQRDGRGVKGLHPIWLELDEAQDYPDAGWMELIETLKRGHDGAVWRAHGVTRGVRDWFYKFTQPNSGWKVHRILAFHRPNWTDQERQEKIELYGSVDHPDYRRNVLGLHGDATNPLFVLHRLMKVVDTEEASDYNVNEYQYFRINDEMLMEHNGDIAQMLDFNHKHKAYQTFWAGMDVGYTAHPSEILVFAEVTPKGKPSYLKLLTRVHLERIGHQQQVNAILQILQFYNVKAFSMDKTGLGLPLFQDIQERFPHFADAIKGYNFSAKILVDFDSTVEIDEFHGDPVKDAKIERNVLEYSSDKLREFVDNERILLPYDKDLISEFQGQTWTTDKSTMDMYGRTKSYSKGSFHALDAAKMAILGKVQNPIEEFTKKERTTAVTDIFVTF